MSTPGVPDDLRDTLQEAVDTGYLRVGSKENYARLVDAYWALGWETMVPGLVVREGAKFGSFEANVRHGELTPEAVAAVNRVFEAHGVKRDHPPCNERYLRVDRVPVAKLDTLIPEVLAILTAPENRRKLKLRHGGEQGRGATAEYDLRLKADGTVDLVEAGPGILRRILRWFTG